MKDERMTVGPNKGQGKAYKWLLAHVSYPHEDWCLVWPYARDKHGRGMLGYDGKQHWAHRFMCRLAHGDPPTPEHTAAHTCGKGHDGCINPHHLAWKTQAENLSDCRDHGTIARHHGGNRRKLLPEQIKAIREARGFQTQGQLAAKFGVSEGTISDIWHGRIYKGLSKINHFRPDEDEKLREMLGRGCTYSDVGRVLDRTVTSVGRRAKALGLKTNFDPHAARGPIKPRPST
jgi:transcriptional regulator with XRE-family HTH domain